MNKYKNDFAYQISGLAWSLWRELGMAGTERFHENCLIQPEELIILTMMVAEYDPRLRDEALDWAVRYHESISISRLRTLLKEVDHHTLDLFSQFATALNSISSAKWPHAMSAVYARPTVSGKSVLPSLDSPSLLALRMRALFGPGAKADLLTHLLTKNGMCFSAADLVEIGYSKRSVMTALDQIAAAGIISMSQVRNKKNYQLKSPKELQVVIGKLPKLAPSWNNILKAVLAIGAVISEIEQSSESTKSIIIRNCLVKIEPLLPVFISPILNNPPHFEQDWTALISMLNAFRQGNFFMQYEVYDEFDAVCALLLRYFYQVDDCLDGIETIQDEIQQHPQRHSYIFKECYQLFYSFANELEIELKALLDFPFHKIMDEQLSEVVYRFSKEKQEKVLEIIKRIPTLDSIVSSTFAQQKYKLSMPAFDAIRQFICTCKARFQDLYFIKTDICLLTQADVLFKRHLVSQLFENKVKE